jgi:IS66 C-terminal element
MGLVEVAAVTRFAFGGERAAVMMTLIHTAKLNDIDPQAWLADVLARINDHKIHDRSTIWPRCYPGIGKSRCQAAPKRREPRVLVKSTGFSTAEKSAVTAACQNLIDDFLKPRFLPTIRPTQFDYPVDILGKWHGTKYRFIQRYRSGFPENLGEEFDGLLHPH